MSKNGNTTNPSRVLEELLAASLRQPREYGMVFDSGVAAYIDAMAESARKDVEVDRELSAISYIDIDSCRDKHFKEAYKRGAEDIK